MPADQPELRAQLDRIAAELTAALEDLRELARGIHPAILSEGGLGPAVKALARRSAVPVELDLDLAGEVARAGRGGGVLRGLGGAGQRGQARPRRGRGVAAAAEGARCACPYTTTGSAVPRPGPGRGCSGSPTGSSRWAGRSRWTARRGRAPPCASCCRPARGNPGTDLVTGARRRRKAGKILPMTGQSDRQTGTRPARR